MAAIVWVGYGQNWLGSCAVVGFGISGVEPLCSATRGLVN